MVAVVSHETSQRALENGGTSRFCCREHLCQLIPLENRSSVPVQRFDSGMSVISAR